MSVPSVPSAHVTRQGRSVVLDPTASAEVLLAVATFVRRETVAGGFVHPVLLEVVRACQERPEPRVSLGDPQPPAPDLVTVAEAASLLGVTERRVRDLCDEGRLAGARLEGWSPANGRPCWRIPRASVLARASRGSVVASACSVAAASTATDDDPARGRP